MTKIIIIEGQDNTGKDTLIKSLSNKRLSIKEYHFTSPEKYNPNIEDKVLAQKLQFVEIFNYVKKDLEENKFDLIILNRSHVGEYVYGSIYRNTNPDWVFKEFEPEFLDILKQSYLILLTAPPELSLKNDDGLSHSTKLKDKELEYYRFLRAFGLSQIKNKIIVPVHEKNTTEFRNKQEILTDILNFIQ